MAYVLARPNDEQVQIARSGMDAPTLQGVPLDDPKTQPEQLWASVDPMNSDIGPSNSPVVFQADSPQNPYAPVDTGNGISYPMMENGQPVMSAPDPWESVPMAGANQDAPVALPPDSVKAAQDLYQANTSQLAKSQALYDLHVKQLADTYGRLGNLQIAPSNVNPVTPQERMIAAGLGLLGVFGGARNAAQASAGYINNRNADILRDQQLRQQQYQAQRLPFENLAKQQMQLLGIDDRNLNNAQTNLTRAGTLLSSAQSKADALKETKRKIDAAVKHYDDIVQHWGRVDQFKEDKLDADTDYRFSKLDQDADIAKGNRESREQIAKDRNKTVTDIASSNNTTRTNLKATDVDVQTAKMINEHAVNSYKQDYTAALNVFKSAGQRYEAAKAKALEAAKVNIKGKAMYSADQVEQAQAELAAAGSDLAQAATRLDEVQKRTVDIVLPKAQAPGAGQSNPLPQTYRGSSGLSSRAGTRQSRVIPVPSDRPVLSGKGSWFGGSDDKDDKWYVPTASGYLIGDRPSSQGDWVALMPAVAAKIGAKYGDKIAIRNPYNGQVVVGVYRDRGPHPSTRRTIDMAKGLMNGVGGQTDMQFQFWRAD